jgi:hypothetical protein
MKRVAACAGDRGDCDAFAPALAQAACTADHHCFTAGQASH